MRNEWTKVAAATVVILAVNALLANWYTETVMRESIAVRTETQFHENRDGLETLILGDSHSKWDVDARRLNAAFNGALPAQSYMEAYYLLRSHIERGWIDPRFLIIGVDLHSFVKRPGSRWAFLHFYARHVDYLEEGWRRGEPLYFAMRQIQGRYAPYAGARANILHYLQSGRPLESEQLMDVAIRRGSLVRKAGFDAIAKAERTAAARLRAAMHLRRRESFDPRNVDDFGRLLDLCHEKGIRVLLVKFPLTREYLDAADPLIDIDEHDRRLAELVDDRAGVAVLDVRSRFSDRAELFTDPDHLNSRGAKLLAAGINAALGRLAANPG